MDATYIDAEVRGRLRQWKTKLAARYRRLDHLLASTTALGADLSALCTRSSTASRQQAFSKIAKRIAGTGATLEGVRLDGRAPCAVWSILKPRDSVIVEPDDPSDAQNCVTVNYIFAGDLDGIPHLADGLWTLEIPDHALGRLLHRNPVDPTASVAATHHATLRLRQEDAFRGRRTDPNFGFLLPAGPGGFVCSISHGPDVSLGNAMTVHVRAHTWLSDDMLRDGQTALIDDGAPGDRLGDSWLLPAPLRRIIKDTSGEARVMVRVPGLPDLLATPKGRA